MSKERIKVVSAAIVSQGKYLITQRAAKAVLPHLWEFPGGKIEAGETKEAALKRELKERLCVDVEVHEVFVFTHLPHGGQRCLDCLGRPGFERFEVGQEASERGIARPVVLGQHLLDRFGLVHDVLIVCKQDARLRLHIAERAKARAGREHAGGRVLIERRHR